MLALDVLGLVAVRHGRALQVGAGGRTCGRARARGRAQQRPRRAALLLRSRRACGPAAQGASARAAAAARPAGHAAGRDSAPTSPARSNGWDGCCRTARSCSSARTSWATGLEHPLSLLAQRHDVIALTIEDPAEQSLPDVGRGPPRRPGDGRRGGRRHQRPGGAGVVRRADRRASSARGRSCSAGSASTRCSCAPTRATWSRCSSFFRARARRAHGAVRTARALRCARRSCLLATVAAARPRAGRRLALPLAADPASRATVRAQRASWCVPTRSRWVTPSRSPCACACRSRRPCPLARARRHRRHDRAPRPDGAPRRCGGGWHAGGDASSIRWPRGTPASWSTGWPAVPRGHRCRHGGVSLAERVSMCGAC